jgi:MerR family redox-sensitive transcriptional activator SoxR
VRCLRPDNAVWQGEFRQLYATRKSQSRTCSKEDFQAEVRRVTISEVARRSGVAASALRFYEERGLVKSERTGSGHRRYPRAVLRRIAFIVFAQRMGLTLEEVGAELVKLPQNRVPERTDWAKISASWTKRIDERIAELERLRAGLTRCIGCGCLSLQDCQLANPGDRASRLGPGPRYWIGDKKTLK